MNDQTLIEAARKRLDDLKELTAAGLISDVGEFFPAGVHYPPITMYPPDEEEQYLKTYTPPDDHRFVLYAHIPFCPARCTYCHYPVTTGVSELRQEAYLDLFEKEMDMWLDRFGIPRFKTHSVLIAGGTPSYLSPRLFKRFHEIFEKRVDLDQCTQFAYDVHPLTLIGPQGRERLKIMRDYRSERLTIGLNAMDDGLLRKMNRRHTSAESAEAVKSCRDAGYEDICVEFIYGYPDLSTEMWIQCIKDAIALDVDEIQTYRLKIIPYGDARGPIERLYEKHPERFPGLEESLLQKQISILMLNEAGYNETLIRVFSRDPDFYSHYAFDQCCSQYDTLGMGLSAFSSLRDRFSINTDSMKDYVERIKSGRLPVNRGLVRDVEAALRWHMVLPLKNNDVLKSAYKEQTGYDVHDIWGSEIKALKSFGLVEENDHVVKLTRKGRFFADEVCTQFYDPEFIPFPMESYADGPLKLFKTTADPRAKVVNA